MSFLTTLAEDTEPGWYQNGVNYLRADLLGTTTLQQQASIDAAAAANAGAQQRAGVPPGSRTTPAGSSNAQNAQNAATNAAADEWDAFKKAGEYFAGGQVVTVIAVAGVAYLTSDYWLPVVRRWLA